MKASKIKVPPAVKVLIVVCYVLFVLFISISVIELYRFPSDSLSNYPNTHWQCDQLGLDFYVDGSGMISGFLDIDSKVISLDVEAHSSTTFHSNYIQCVDDNSSAKTLYMVCFYENINNGEFYVIVVSDESTIDLNIMENVIPYKFVLIEK